MRTKLWVLAVILSFGSISFHGCGGANSISTAPRGSNTPTGSVGVFAGDAPLCNVLSFSVTITGATLTPQSGGSPVSVISSSQPVTVDFASLMGFMTMLDLASVPAGTYSRATLTLSNPQMAVLDPSKTPMAPTTMTVTMSTSTVTINLDPVLSVASKGTVGLHLDFDLLKSVQTDATGNITGTVNPLIQASLMPVTMGSMGEIDDLHGIVQSINTSSPDPAFTGSFALLQGMMGRTFTVNVATSTYFDGVSDLSALQTGTFVVVDASVDSNGNLVANVVNVEDRTDMQQQMGAFMGTIMSITRDASGNATQFTMAVREEFPDLQSMMPMMSSPVVNISQNTHFDISAKDDNLAQMTFGPSTMGVGQNVVVNGQIQASGGMMGGTSSLIANSIVLTLQPVTGNFMSTLSVGSDGKTGGFSMAPCSAMFSNQSMSMLTFNQTGFSGVADLNGMSTGPMLVNKGLLFFQPRTTQLGSMTVPAGTVFVTKQVQQVP